MKHASLQGEGWDFGIIAARTIPDGVMGSAVHNNGLAVGHDYPEDFEHYKEYTAGKVLIAGPNTAQYVLSQQGTLGRDVVIAGLHAPKDVPHRAESLDEAFWRVKDGWLGLDREIMVVGGQNMIRGACEMVRSWNAGASRSAGMRALLLMTEFYDTGRPRKYPAEPGLPVLDTLPSNVHEFERIRQPNGVQGRPDFDFVSYSVR